MFSFKYANIIYIGSQQKVKANNSEGNLILTIRLLQLDYKKMEKASYTPRLLKKFWSLPCLHTTEQTVTPTLLPSSAYQSNRFVGVHLDHLEAAFFPWHGSKLSLPYKEPYGDTYFKSRNHYIQKAMTVLVIMHEI